MSSRKTASRKKEDYTCEEKKNNTETQVHGSANYTVSCLMWLTLSGELEVVLHSVGWPILWLYGPSPSPSLGAAATGHQLLPNG